MMWRFITPDFLKFFIPLVGGAFAWFFNEHRKRSFEEYQRKEERYTELVESLKGFYVGTHDRCMKQKFLDQLNLCWLYCPDIVIEKAYKFISTVHTDVKCTDLEKETALGELMLAIRKDLLSRKVVRKTNLTADDFKHFLAM